MESERGRCEGANKAHRLKCYQNVGEPRLLIAPHFNSVITFIEFEWRVVDKWSLCTVLHDMPILC